MKSDWRKTQIIYQVYPKSFKDTNGDGIGDLRGVIEKIDYLKELGINTIWLNPIFVSPQVDNGYDISNYYAIDERLGTMKDFDELVIAAHERNIKIVLDFVMNHTSDQHPWFQDACKSKNSIYRDYYLWQEGTKGRLPNNWKSFFGGSVWEPDPLNNHNYYFHLFDKHMPDLNWNNPEVRHSMYQIAKFWIEHGVDGFRLDAFIHISKANFRQNVLTGGTSELQLAEEFYANLPKVQDYLREFVQKIRAIKKDVFILGEAASANANLAADYTNPQNNECDAVVTFRYFHDNKEKPLPNLPLDGQPFPLDFVQLKKSIVQWENTLQGISYPILYWNNHDMARILTRVNVKPQYKTIAAKMLATLMYLQKGIPCIYYGEELGMESLVMNDIDDFHDCQSRKFYEYGLHHGYSKEEMLSIISRVHKMAARGPIPWNHQKHCGFSDGQPWIKGKAYGDPVIDQLRDPQSVLQYYRQLLKLKHQDLFVEGDYLLENTRDELYVYSRELNGKKALVICNLTDNSQEFAIDDAEEILINGQIQFENGLLKLSPYASGVYLVKG